MASAIEEDILIEAPVDVVWRAVTEPAQLARWFADDVELEPTPDCEGTLTFHYGERSLTYQVAVRAVEPERLFSYRWQHPRGATAAEGNSTLVEFTLSPEGGGTLLRVVETGVEEMDWPADQQYRYANEHSDGWVHYFGRLHDHLAGQPG
jgi:uncharacterized protein YndB with AHSA1/START domain